MNIGIDARLLERKITGIGRFLIILLENFPLYDKKNTYYLFTYDKVEFRSDFYKNIPTIKSFIPQKIFSPIWCNFLLPFYLKKHKIDILFSANQVVPLLKVKGCKYISVVHDVIYKADPSFLPFIYRKYLQTFAYFSVRVSDLIITVSEYSKSDILKHYNINPDKVKVVHQSANKLFRPEIISETEEKSFKEKYSLTGKVVLYVGMIENRKNIQVILQVADLFAEIRKELVFVLIGKIGYGGKKIKTEISKRKNVIHLMNIDDETLAKFYNISDVFLFPSLYEGFGYPPLEAMQSGLPVIASDNTSLREIVADGGVLCNPNDYHKIYNEICKLLDDENYREKIRLAGIERAKNFSLEKSIIQILELFKSFDKHN
ncbi:MAG: glycosyltransferase family 4 protein [Ignavibacterium sp.]|jgi:glycosyltransferase involved in cell wall biosynthesis|uniref:glycosyltransferase family 4 protein n=1 Tax=Ignavibacterium sp. TaxID=2651167 RepID=UPI00329711DC